MVDATLTFTTPKRNTDPIPFTLDGDEFVFTPPKAAVMVLPLFEAIGNGSDAEVESGRALLDWLSTGLPEESVQRIWDRLRAEDDDLDIDTLSAVAQALSTKVAGNRPPT